MDIINRQLSRLESQRREASARGSAGQLKLLDQELAAALAARNHLVSRYAERISSVH